MQRNAMRVFSCPDPAETDPGLSFTGQPRDPLSGARAAP
jgi:hypothetical protein